MRCPTEVALLVGETEARNQETEDKGRKWDKTRQRAVGRRGLEATGPRFTQHNLRLEDPSSSPAVGGECLWQFLFPTETSVPS